MFLTTVKVCQKLPVTNNLSQVVNVWLALANHSTYSAEWNDIERSDRDVLYRSAMILCCVEWRFASTLSIYLSMWNIETKPTELALNHNFQSPDVFTMGDWPKVVGLCMVGLCMYYEYTVLLIIMWWTCADNQIVIFPIIFILPYAWTYNKQLIPPPKKKWMGYSISLQR